MLDRQLTIGSEVLTVRRFWHSKRRAHREHVAAHRAPVRDRLAGLKPLRVDADDDRPTREDKEREKAARRGGGSGGGPPAM